jgi:hypothetical protein
VADYYTHFSVAVRLQGKFAAAWTGDELRRRRRKRQELIDAGDDDAADVVGIDFDALVEDGVLYVTDDGATGNLEDVAAFLQRLIKLGYVQDPVTVMWSESCSRPRPDSFGGGAVVVTKRKQHWFIVRDLVDKKIAALMRRRQRQA